MFGNRNFGYFEIPEKAFIHTDIVHEILNQVIVLKAEYHYDDMRMHYFGLCDSFEEVPASTEAPHYNVTCQDYLEEKPLVFQRGDRMNELNWLERKLYNCQTCYDTQTIICPNCHGSGESMADGSDCTHCDKSGGEVRCPDCGMEDV